MSSEDLGNNISKSENPTNYEDYVAEKFGYSVSEMFENFRHSFLLNYKMLRKTIRKYVNEKIDKKFTNIIYLTAECPIYMPNTESQDSPIDFIYEMRKQYPDTEIRLMIPIIGLDSNTKIAKKINIETEHDNFELERTSINCSFFAKSMNCECAVYKFRKNEFNVTIYGIYSDSFSYLKTSEELMSFDKLIFFIKAARAVIKNLKKDGFKPDIVQAEKVPFFMGAEFESKFPTSIKVLQVFDNFAKLEKNKQEPFWSILNLADKENIKKICSDAYIENCFAKLFSIPAKNVFPRMEECISLIYENYKIFHNSEPEETQNNGDIIFRHLNRRIKKLFPNFIEDNNEYYYPFLNSLINCNFWAVYSETYYKDLYREKLASPNIMKNLDKTAYKSGFLPCAVNFENYFIESEIGMHNKFDSNNFLEERTKNKKTIIKEFSSSSIKTKFIDETIFRTPDYAKICGYLDTFYSAPLLFANPKSEVFEEGVDILFSTLLKLFERNRNIQMIISIKNGLKNNYIKSVVDFLEENKIFMGRWVYIDDDLNPAKIYSSADIYLYPARICDKSVKHLTGIHYGCVPIVSNAGLLNDAVIDIFDDISDGNGFKVKQSLLYEDENTNLYINTLEKALDLYNNNPSSWNIIVKNCINTNTGWDFSKLEHINQIYENII